MRYEQGLLAERECHKLLFGFKRMAGDDYPLDYYTHGHRIHRLSSDQWFQRSQAMSRAIIPEEPTSGWIW